MTFTDDCWLNEVTFVSDEQTELDNALVSTNFFLGDTSQDIIVGLYAGGVSEITDSFSLRACGIRSITYQFS